MFWLKLLRRENPKRKQTADKNNTNGIKYQITAENSKQIAENSKQIAENNKQIAENSKQTAKK